MTMRRPFSIFGCTRGAAAAEMALITPLLLVILFGGFEAGAYFWTEHKVVKGVRDGARFAARQPFTAYSGCNAPTGTTLDNIRNLTRTGQLSGGTAKVSGWTDADVAVTVACQASAPNSYTSGGVYATEATGAMHVTVSTTVNYPSLFGTLGFDTTGAVVRASSNAAVMGT
ncbi:pilus assembly protein [Sphingopyxis sp. DHUNG17]|jgi:Flp pilus assembly protein TadG|uniref:TadE/TadG family type IV pilus assembly protein n=1 Tax=Sphingopyxis jiangsuensis TaxID=2871171 RepID=UPI00191C9A35|nr:TadE family protein [Sphingopyxis lutea]MBL0769589.1 pilus assembly protein [Sphingopyxis lutea]